jgi:hypothetical protein
MAYDYLAKVAKTGHSELRYFTANNGEAYEEGMFVEMVAGVARACTSSSFGTIGVCRETKTGVTDTLVAVEVPVDSYCEFDVYADDAVTMGKNYGLNSDGSIDAGATDLNSMFVCTKTTTAAGISRFKLVKAEPVEYKVKVAITNGQIKALRGTPKTLVAAPGAGRTLEFVSAMFFLDYGSNVFTESADNMAIKYTDGAGVIVSDTIEATNFIDAAADTFTNAIAKKDNIVAVSGAQNKALVLHNTGDGEYAGNAGADTTITAIVTYRVHTI